MSRLPQDIALAVVTVNPCDGAMRLNRDATRYGDQELPDQHTGYHDRRGRRDVHAGVSYNVQYVPSVSRTRSNGPRVWE